MGELLDLNMYKDRLYTYVFYISVHNFLLHVNDMLVERGDGSYDSTSLFLYIRQLL